jgi:DNA-binding GntR family transcriptional regulator
MPDRKPIVLQHTRESLAESVFRALRKAILEGELEPGEWLRQEALAEELNVSQVTVRDALNQLVGEGLANRIPYKGVHVATLSPVELEDIYAMRAVLEGLAAKSAAQRISEKSLQEMRDLLPVTIVDNDPESVSRAREANRRFHQIFIEASQRRFLIRVLNQILDWIDPLMLYSRTMKTEIGLETRLKWGERDRYQHTRLLEALEAGDGELAGKVATEAVEEAWDNLAELILEKPENE